ncbi:MAG: beta-galactosidase [Candidatus Pacebacteria bacterium]|nr:beta-galactosidase [Candidatus Paceibacterota bacterium]
MAKEIIQQWQFLGRVHPELMKDSLFEKCKELGITSLQSYLPWSEVEREKGNWDFSVYDPLVEKLKKHNLKWVPFLILGPEYAVPEWFHNSKESVYAKCLEHGKKSRIQSIWNPYLPKYVDEFLKKVSEHYQDKNILESIEVGISGNWGEAIFPGVGGFNKGFHTHLGWWAGDEFARKDFKDYLTKKYGESADFSFPKLKKKIDLKVFLINSAGKLPPSFKNFLKRSLRSASPAKSFLVFDKGAEPEKKDEKWLDFIEWYFGSMNRWAEFWLKTAKKYFPETRIYLVTGGTAHPALGANFSEQAKISARNGAEIRITNQTNEYSQSFTLTSLMASACRFYGADFVTEEEAVLQTGEGVVMRIFDALSSGAKGIYCKNFISTGGDPVIRKYMPIGSLTPGAESLKENLKYLKEEKPIIARAVLFPNISIALNPETLINLYNKCSLLRSRMNFDLVDESMIKDGVLKNYKYLLILEGDVSEGVALVKIKEWQNQGGILTSDSAKLPKEFNEEKGVYGANFEKKVVYYNSNKNSILEVNNK